MLANQTKARQTNLFSGLVFNNPGGFLLSHAVARAVPSAPRGLTSVFGMGTGVTLSTQPPENFSKKTIFDLCTLIFVIRPQAESVNCGRLKTKIEDQSSKIKSFSVAETWRSACKPLRVAQPSGPRVRATELVRLNPDASGFNRSLVFVLWPL